MNLEELVADFRGERPKKDRKSTWEKNIGALCHFKAQHGHCNVPSRYPENKSLANWVHNVRSRLLTQEQVRQLKELGFVFHPKDEKWENHIKDLVAFKEAHGHFEVPRNRENPSLRRWLDCIRYNKTLRLTPAKMEELDQLG
jgi:hypothetical protein